MPSRAPGPLAWIAGHDGQIFVQPSGEEAVVLHNGSRIAGSTWLRDGDVLDVGGGRLKLRVDDGNFTIPGNSWVDVFKDKRLSVDPIPEPGSLALLALGVCALLIRRRR